MIHLHVHSNHSMLEGTVKPRQLVARAVEHGMKALALTDTNGLYAAIPFYKAARDAGIRPILGAQLGKAVFLAKDREGYGQLCEIVTQVQLGNVQKDALGAWPFSFGGEHLFALSADRAWLEAWRDKGIEPLAAVTHYGDGASRYRASGLHDWARDSGIRAVAVNPVYFLDAGQYEIHRVLAAIRHNTTVGALESGETANPGDWFRSPAMMERLYAGFPGLLDSTDWVAEECQVELALGKPLFPACELPDGETDFSWLWKLTFEGLKRRYHPITPAIIDRTRYELDVIHRLGFAAYFLIVSDIVQFAVAHDIPAVGRGSAANSVVAYALGITRVDPFKYGLYFERFLNPSRTDCPDIDLDVRWDRRDEVLDYIYRRHGADRVAMIATLNTFGARSAVREIGKALGLTERQVDAFARHLPHYAARDLSSVIARIPECRNLRDAGEQFKRIVEIGEFLDGFPRHLSIHACGVLIAPGPITHYVPLQRTTKGLVITQYDMHPIEELGLVKMDILGHRALSVIQDTVQSVRRSRGVSLDIEAIPDADPLTAGYLRGGRTIGCFQVESPAMRGLLQRMQACDVHTLIQAIALVRPGASGSGMKQHFIDRHHGREVVEYVHPSLAQVLSETYGVMIYQEDVLKVAHAVTGMDLAEADALRRAMSKKLGPREMAKSMKSFLERAAGNGVDELSAQTIWELISNFAAYSYCKAHASTYGELSYQCAYLKAHFPADFFAAVLSNRGGFYPPPVYLEEAKRCGISILPPDVQRSEYRYTAENGAVRTGFVEVRNLSQVAIEAILGARRVRPFENLLELLERTGMSHADAEALFHAGGFDSFSIPRPAQRWQIESFRPRTKADASSFQPGQTASLFQGFGKMNPSPFCLGIPDYSSRKRIELEWGALGMLGERHPLDFYAARLHGSALIASSALSAYEGKTVSLLGWPIAERRLALKSGHGVMKFLTLEDFFGVYEAVLFPAAYQRHGHLLSGAGAYRLTGQVQNEDGVHTLSVELLERESLASFIPVHDSV